MFEQKHTDTDTHTNSNFRQFDLKGFAMWRPRYFRQQRREIIARHSWLLLRQ